MGPLETEPLLRALAALIEADTNIQLDGPTFWLPTPASL